MILSQEEYDEEIYVIMVHVQEKGKIQQSDRLTITLRTTLIIALRQLCWVEEIDQPGGKHYYQSLNALGQPTIFLTSSQETMEGPLGPFITVHFFNTGLFDFMFRQEGALTHTTPHGSRNTIRNQATLIYFVEHTHNSKATVNIL